MACSQLRAEREEQGIEIIFFFEIIIVFFNQAKPYDAKKSVWVPNSNKTEGGYLEGLLESKDGKKATVMVGKEKKVFKESFNTDKARLAKRQVKFNRAANFLILVEDNVQEGAALTAGKIMAFGRGPLKESFLSEGIRFNAQHFYMHANTYDFTKEIVDGDESEEE